MNEELSGVVTDEGMRELLFRESHAHRELVQAVAFFPDNGVDADEIFALALMVDDLNERMESLATVVNREEVIEEEQG
jgi:hypothetical protein